MSQASNDSDPRGLHERAISVALTLIEDNHARLPKVADAARLLNEDPARLSALFPDDRALLVASIEQALILLIDACTRGVVRADPDDPVAQFVTLGDAYLDWASQHPAQFRLTASCQMIDVMAVPSLRRYLDSLADLMVRMLSRARDDGRLHPQEDIDMLALSARCYVNGIARMIVDDRMREWAPGIDPLVMGKRLTHDFVRRMARSSQPQPARPAPVL